MNRTRIAAAALAASLACSVAPKPYEKGSTIPMGEGSVTITRTEVLSDGPNNDVMVFFTWTGPVKDVYGWWPGLTMILQDRTGKKYEPVPVMFYSPLRPVPEDLYSANPASRTIRGYAKATKQRMDEMTGSRRDLEMAVESSRELERRLGQVKADLQQGRNPGRWVHKFRVPQSSQDFVLVVKNPDPREGQPRLAAVALGR